MNNKRCFRLGFQFIFTDQIESTSIQYETDLHAVMYGLKEDLSITGIQRFSIDRQELWEDSIAAFKNPKFDASHRPKVRFLGEAGIDAGGLSREYGIILRKELFSTMANLFEGQEKKKLPIYNINGIQSNLYYLAGKMVAYLIIHLDIGIPFLSPAFYSYIVTQDAGKASECCSVDDVPDFEIKQWINQVHIIHIICIFNWLLNVSKVACANACVGYGCTGLHT